MNTQSTSTQGLIACLGYINVQSSPASLGKWDTFFSKVVGMMPAPGVSKKEGEAFYKMDERPFRVRVFTGEKDRFSSAGWEAVGVDAYEELIRRLEKAGVSLTRGTPQEADARCVRELVHGTDPAGNAFELYHGRIYDYFRFVSPVGVQGFVAGDMGLGHVVLPCPDAFEKCHDFYTNIMTFAQTDEMDFGEMGHIQFLHCNNPRHHSLALYNKRAPGGCVHLMFEVPNMDEVGYAFDRRETEGFHVSSTLGRHTNDRMVSFYMYSPGRFSVEIGTGAIMPDWETYRPTKSLLPSIWGHKWNPLPKD